MRRQIFDALVGPGLFIGAVEILQRERYVVGQPLQQLGEFGRERFLLEGNENHDADHAPLREQRERAAGICAIAARSVVERFDAGVGQIIVDDAGLPRTDRPAGEPASLGAHDAGRDTHLQRAGGGWTGGSDDIEEVVVRLHQHDRGRGKFAAFGRGFAHQFEQLRPRIRAHDRFVGRAQRRQHTRQALLLHLGSCLVVGMVEILQRKRHVVDEPLQQLRQTRA